jgi:hypothetical protein
VDGEWQPAVIATREYILQFHLNDYGRVSKHAGKLIRVRINEETKLLFMSIRNQQNGCSANISLEVHPDDAALLWPEDTMAGYRITLCEHCVLTD